MSQAGPANVPRQGTCKCSQAGNNDIPRQGTVGIAQEHCAKKFWQRFAINPLGATPPPTKCVLCDELACLLTGRGALVKIDFDNMILHKLFNLINSNRTSTM